MEKVSPVHRKKNETNTYLKKQHLEKKKINLAHIQHAFQKHDRRDYADRIQDSTEILKLNKRKATLTTEFPE